MIEIYKNKKIYLLMVVGGLVGSMACFTGNWAIIIVAGIILLLTTLLNPKFGVFILLFLQLGLIKSTSGLTNQETIFIIFFGSTIIGWILRQLLKKKTRISWSPINLPVLSFLSFCVFSFVKASYNNISIVNWFTEWRAFLVLILFFVILNEFKSKKELKWLIYSFLLITLLICLRDIFLFIQQGGFERLFKAAGLQYASLFFIMAIPFSITIFLTAKNFLLKWSQIPLILICAFRLLIGLMRSYILAILSMLTVFIVILLILKILKNKKIFSRAVTLITLICIISGIIFLIFPTQMNKIIKNNITRFVVLKNFSSPKNVSALTHAIEIKAAWKYAIKQPLLGHGFGFKYQYYRPNQKFVDGAIVHFVPLFFILKIGFIGTLSIIWLITTILMLNWQIFKKEKDLSWKLLEIAIFSNFIGFIILSFFVTNVIRIDSIFYFTLATGIIATIKKIQDKTNTTLNPIIRIKNCGQ